MYSVAGDADTSILSPFPLIPSIPSSTPVAKIYLEKNGGFAKTSVSAPIVTNSLGNNAAGQLANILSFMKMKQKPLHYC